VNRDFSRGAASPSGTGTGAFPAPNTPRPDASGVDEAAGCAGRLGARVFVACETEDATGVFVGLGAGMPPLIPAATRF
jgi:hypothetical protein